MSPDDGRVAFSQVELHLVVESIEHIVWVAGADGTIEYLNREGNEYTGHPLDASGEWGWLPLVHPDDVARARRAWEHASRTVIPFRFECRIRRADGAHRWHDFRGRPSRRPGGDVLKWIGTAIDIEDQKRLKADLCRSEHNAAEARGSCESTRRWRK